MSSNEWNLFHLKYRILICTQFEKHWATKWHRQNFRSRLLESACNRPKLHVLKFHLFENSYSDSPGPRSPHSPPKLHLPKSYSASSGYRTWASNGLSFGQPLCDLTQRSWISWCPALGFSGAVEVCRLRLRDRLRPYLKRRNWLRVLKYTIGSEQSEYLRIADGIKQYATAKSTRWRHVTQFQPPYCRLLRRRRFQCHR